MGLWRMKTLLDHSTAPAGVISGKIPRPASEKTGEVDAPLTTQSAAPRIIPAAAETAEEVPPLTLLMEKKRQITPQEDYMAPRWSTDGLDILASKGKYNGLYLISADGGDVRQISDEPGIGYHASWSPDGNYIVVEEEDRTRYFDRSGDEVDADLVGLEARPPVYAKDGIVYLQAGVSRSEADETVIADEDKYFEPVASPDGTKIAYIGLESGIIIKDLSSQEDIIIGEGTDICWTPDSSGIIFNYTQDDGKQIVDGDIFYASATGGEAQNLTDTPDLIERRPDLSGDGSKLTYEVEGQIFSVDVVLH
jgi:Tol biopolymer transport system component